jgi:4-hydroxybenzoyl-CoA reductase beta subunit
MKLPHFEYLEPATVPEALAMLDTYRDRAAVIAGGTELVNRLRLRLIGPEYVMNIKKLSDLSGIAEQDQSIVIGATASLRDIGESALLNNKYQAIAEAARQVASPPVAQMATVGGNVLQNTRCLLYNQSGIVLNGLDACYKRGGALCLAVKGSKRCFSVYQGDMVPALMAFDAQCILARSGSQRTISLQELFTGKGRQPFTIENNELLTAIVIPKRTGAAGSSYHKLRLRGSIDYPLASAAAFLGLDADQKIAVSRLVIGAAGSTPRVVDGASAALLGKSAVEADFSAAAGLAYELAEGVNNLDMPGDYRRKMVRVFAERALRGALERACTAVKR